MPVKGEDLGALAASAIREHLAVDATYQAPSGPVIDTRAIVSKELIEGSLDSSVPEMVTALTLFKTDIGKAKPNAVVIVNGKTYTVERPLEEDDYIHQVAVRVS